MTPVIAHTGHWLANLLYVLPLAVALGFLALQAIRDRRRNQPEASDAPAAESPPPV